MPVSIEKNWMQIRRHQRLAPLMREAVLLSLRDGTGQALPE
jgi:hypothetical protein